MKWVRTAIGAVIAISVIPVIILTVINVTELKDVKNVQFELLSEEDDIFFITSGTYDKLIEHKNIITYDIESNYPLITQEEMDRASWKINDELKNEIYIDENGQKMIRENVGKIILDGSESGWWMSDLQPSGTYAISLRIPELNELAGLFPQGHIKELDIYLSDIAIYNIPYNSWFNGEFLYLVLPADFLPVMTLDNFKNYLSQNPLTIYYELLDKSTRPVEVYDFSTFKLTYDKNRIKVVFDIDDEYYLWEITQDDKMTPINGQYDLGNIWTVKFYVYEIQQPLIRSLVLLIPLIVISGLLYYLYILVSKRE